MGKEQMEVLDRLRELNIDHHTFGQVESIEGLAQTLLLKDKKQHCLYMVTAHHSTKVNIRALTARLGLPKNALQPVPDPLCTAVFQAPVAEVSPLLLCHEHANVVALLVDSKLQSMDTVLLRTGGNGVAALSTAGLEQYLTASQRQLHYVDLEAEPVINRESPPDLRDLAGKAADLPESFKALLAEPESKPAAGGGKPADTAMPAAKPTSSSAGGSQRQQQATAAAAGGAPSNVDATVQRIVGSLEARSKDAGADCEPAAITDDVRAAIRDRVASGVQAAYVTGLRAGLLKPGSQPSLPNPPPGPRPDDILDIVNTILELAQVASRTPTDRSRITGDLQSKVALAISVSHAAGFKEALQRRAEARRTLVESHTSLF